MLGPRHQRHDVRKDAGARGEQPDAGAFREVRQRTGCSSAAFYVKITIILPRQARDEDSENAQKDPLSYSDEAVDRLIIGAKSAFWESSF